MAHTLIFDTLAYANKLKKAGVPEKQAEIQAEAFAEIIEDKIATKQDLLKMETRIDLRMAELKTELIRWTLGITVGAVSAQSTIVLTFIKLLH